MTKLKLGTFVDEKLVKVTLELPAALHRDLVAYAAIRARGYPSDQAPSADARGFMATDRVFRREIRENGSLRTTS